LTGIVVANGLVYQGVTLSTLPVYFLANNCANCSDLFTVIISPSMLGVNYSIQYVLYSQYWFVISFSYSSPITPSFSFDIQINSKYASYFTSADMAQSVTNSVSPIQYPTSLIKNTIQARPTALNKGGLQTNQNGMQGINPAPSTTSSNSASTSNSATSSTSPSASVSTRIVIDAGTSKQFSLDTIVSLFN
jgi:hypothetical protein